MNRSDFVKMMGADQGDSDYLPVACLLRAGYGVAGHFNRRLNEDLTDTCMLLNARLTEFREARSASSASIADFNDFIEAIVTRNYQHNDDPLGVDDPSVKVVPMVAIPMNEISVVYPVAHISKMMASLGETQAEGRVPTFFDFDKSITLRMLRTKLW